MQLSIKLPSIHEQEKIGQLFQSLDKTITLHEEKQRQLEQLKKALLQKMFADETGYPALRFKGFTSTWEQQELGEISKVTIGEFVIKTKQSDNGLYPVYNGGTSYTGKYEEYNNNGPKILISARGANAGYVNFIEGKYWAGNSCYSVGITNEEYSVRYLYQYLMANQRLLTGYQQAANIPSVSKKDVEHFIFKSPRLKEQNKIGLLFTNIDNLITLHQHKIDNLKLLKRALLQKMFV